MNLRTIARHARARVHRPLHMARPPVGRRPSLYLASAAAGAVMVAVLSPGEPAAQAETATQSVSIAEQLGLGSESAAPVGGDSMRPLEQLAASRSDRQAEQAAA